MNNGSNREPRFRWIALGVEGGLDEANLNAYLVSTVGSHDFVCLDAGTLMAGLEVAVGLGRFADLPVPAETGLSVQGQVLRERVKAYLITHGYLDHVQGLAEISPNDSAKPLYGLSCVIEDLRDHLFNWRLWPNLCNEGVEPRLGRYSYVRLRPGEPTSIPGTPLTVEAHHLAHGPFTDSTAFLLEHAGHSLLYMGDTGPDEVEGRSTTRTLWERIAPLVRDGRLHGLFIEASYPDERPDEELFSHLTPRWVMHAMWELARLVDPAAPGDALRGLPVMVVHIKPDLDGTRDVVELVRMQLRERNDLGLHLVFPEQGQELHL